MILYTDGSVQHNGKPEGYAGWAMVNDRPDKLTVRYGHFKPTSTNGRGEIGGVLYALALFWQSRVPLHFISDAQYVIRSINEWRHKHKHYDYEGIKNVDMLRPLYHLWDAHGLSKIEWVKGHSGVRGNEIADVWCDKGCRGKIENVQNKNADIRFVSHEEYWETVNRAHQSLISSKSSTSNVIMTAS